MKNDHKCFHLCERTLVLHASFIYFKNLKKKPIGGKGRVLFQGGIHISLFMNVMASESFAYGHIDECV